MVKKDIYNNIYNKAIKIGRRLGYTVNKRTIKDFNIPDIIQNLNTYLDILYNSKDKKERKYVRREIKFFILIRQLKVLKSYENNQSRIIP
jgi:hypothetical protein